MKKKIFLYILFSTFILIFIFANKSYAKEFNYKIETKLIHRIEPKTAVTEFLSDLTSKVKTNDSDVIDIFEFVNGNYAKVTTGFIKSGMVATKNFTSITDEGNGVRKIHAEKTYRISVIGDINKDGKCDAIDLTKIIKHIIGITEAQITDEYLLKSADVNESEKVDVTDLTAMIKYIVSGKIPQNTSRQNYTMQLSETSGEIACPTPITFTVTNPTGGNITVSSSDESVATANVNGTTITVTPVAQGNATITVNSAETAEYKAGSATYNVKVNKGTGYITLSATEGTVGVGETITFSITSSHGNSFEWQNHNSSIVKVTSTPSQNTIVYSVTGIKAGTTTITIKATENDSYTEATADFIVTCVADTPSQQNYTMQLSKTSGETTCPTPITFTVTNPTGGKIMATSSNNSVATASVDGTTITVNPVSKGNARITVTSEATENYKAGSATFDISVKQGTGYITLSATEGVVKKGETTILSVLNKSGSLSVSVENSLIAGVAFGENNTIIITGRRTGETTITITAQGNESYTSATATYTIRCISDSGNYTMQLSETSGTTTCPNQKTFTVTNPTGGKITVSSSNNNIARATASGSVITVTPMGAGVATITVTSAETDEYSEGIAEYTITVNKGTGYITLSTTETTVSVGETKTINITSVNGGNLHAKLSIPNPNIADADIILKERKITVTGVAPGETTITVTMDENEGYTESSASLKVICIE